MGKRITSMSVLVMACTSLACDCIITPIEEHIKDTPAIAVVRIIRLLDTDEQRNQMISSLPDHGHNVEAVIETPYKGTFSVGDTVRIASMRSNCDPYFALGSEWVLFFREVGPDYRVRHCSYSEPMTRARNVIAALERSKE